LIDLSYYVSAANEKKNTGCKGEGDKNIYLTPAIPAVVVPSFLKTGLSFANPDAVVPGLIPSSTAITTFFPSPVLGSTI